MQTERLQVSGLQPGTTHFEPSIVGTDLTRGANLYASGRNRKNKKKTNKERNLTVANWVFAQTTHVVGGSAISELWGGGSNFALSHYFGQSQYHSIAR